MAKIEYHASDRDLSDLNQPDLIFDSDGDIVEDKPLYPDVWCTDCKYFQMDVLSSDNPIADSSFDKEGYSCAHPSFNGRNKWLVDMETYEKDFKHMFPAPDFCPDIVKNSKKMIHNNFGKDMFFYNRHWWNNNISPLEFLDKSKIKLAHVEEIFDADMNGYRVRGTFIDGFVEYVFISNKTVMQSKLSVRELAEREFKHGERSL